MKVAPVGQYSSATHSLIHPCSCMSACLLSLGICLLPCVAAANCPGANTLNLLAPGPTYAVCHVQHYQLMLLAMAGLAVYCVGLWAMVIQVLSYLKKTRSFGDKTPLLLFGWIYDMFDIKVRTGEQCLQRTGEGGERLLSCNI